MPRPAFGYLRVAMAGAAVALLVVAVGFAFQESWATDLWPWPDAGRLSFIFLGSILAAIALPTLWIAASGELGAARAGALNLTIVYGGTFVYLLTLLGDDGQPELGAYLAVFGGAALTTLAAFLWTRRIALHDTRPAPAALRASFGLLAAILIPVGIALMLQADVFPWEVHAESSVIFGLIFLGAAVYFLNGVISPLRANTAGPLAGFLAYDLFLIAPFVRHFDEAEGTKLLSLTVYTAVIAFSAALALYYLFVDPRTRCARSSAGAPT